MDSRYYLCVEVKYNFVRVGLVTDHNLKVSRAITTFDTTVNVSDPRVDLIARIHNSVESFLLKQHISQSNIIGMGITLPGSVSLDGKILLDAPNISIDIRNPLFLAQAISNLYNDLEITLVNDTIARTIAEQQYGSARGGRHVVYILVDWGIGSAMILNGEIYRGHKNLAGEFGHIKVREGSPWCSCGKTGCLEAIASRRVIAERIWNELSGSAKESSLIPSRPDQISAVQIAQINMQYPQTQQILDEAASALGLGLASIINLLSPEYLILGGDMMFDLPYLKEKAKTYAQREALSVNIEPVFRDAKFGADAEIIGIAHLLKFPD